MLSSLKSMSEIIWGGGEKGKEKENKEMPTGPASSSSSASAKEEDGVGQLLDNFTGLSLHENPSPNSAQSHISSSASYFTAPSFSTSETQPALTTSTPHTTSNATDTTSSDDNFLKPKSPRPRTAPSPPSPPPPPPLPPPPPPPMLPEVLFGKARAGVAGAGLSRDGGVFAAALTKQAKEAAALTPAVPTPSRRVRAFHWVKIPPTAVLRGANNLWRAAAQNRTSNPSSQSLDFSRLEELLDENSLRTSSQSYSSHSAQGSPAPVRRASESKSSVLGGQKALNVEIFLRSLGGGAKTALAWLREVGGDTSTERLRELRRLLPTENERGALANLSRESILSSADQFLADLIKIPNYGLRLDVLIFRFEWASAASGLSKDLDLFAQAAAFLRDSQEITDLLGLVLEAGNFANSGREGGEAIGFRLRSLSQLSSLGIFPVLALGAQARGVDVAKVRLGLKSFSRLQSLSLKAVKESVKDLKAGLDILSQRLDSAKSDQQLSETAKEWSLEWKEALINLDYGLERAEKERSETAAWFCEEGNSFELSEAYRHLCLFLSQLSEAKERLRKEAERKERRFSTASLRLSTSLLCPASSPPSTPMTSSAPAAQFTAASCPSSPSLTRSSNDDLQQYLEMSKDWPVGLRAKPPTAPSRRRRFQAQERDRT